MKTLIASLALALVSPQVLAQEFRGADLQYQYVTNSDDIGEWTSQALSGSVEFGFGDFSVQIDGSVSEYDNDGPAPTFGLHGIYRISDGFWIGAFFVAEDWLDAPVASVYNNYGIEARYDFDAAPVSVQAYWLREQAVQGAAYELDSVGATLEYTMANGLSLNAGLANFTGDLTGVLATIGAEYRLDNGIAIGAKYLRFDDGDNHSGFGIYLSKSFGNGVTFNRRDWNAFLSGW